MNEIESPFNLSEANLNVSNLPPSGTVVRTSAGLRLSVNDNPNDLRRLTERSHQERGNPETKEVDLSEYLGQLIYVDGDYNSDLEWVFVRSIGNEEVFRALERAEQGVILSTSGNQERWREIRDFRGMEKYSNWAITTSVLYKLDRQPVHCDYIKVTQCNYKLSGNGFTTNKNYISFTTHRGHGWDNCNFTLEYKYDGQICTCSISYG